MKVWSMILESRSRDRALEDRTGIQRHDPQATKVGGRVYNRGDIRALEEERVGPFWRRRRRNG